MKSLKVMALMLFCSVASAADSELYGPRIGNVTGRSFYPVMMSTFNTGQNQYQLSRVALGNSTRGNLDKLFLCELDSDMNILSTTELSYYMFTANVKYGMINFYKPPYAVNLKARTRYGLMLVKGSSGQSWTNFSTRMSGTDATGIVQTGNFYLGSCFENMNNNLVVFIYGNQL